MNRLRVVWSLTLAFLALLAMEGAPLADDYIIPPEKKDHWASKAPSRPLVPTVKNPSWVRSPVDAFVLAKLEAAGLEPAPAAPREQLIRRVTLDLIGLPPTPEEIDAYLGDSTPDAWEKVIDRLLASPHYGERWGRHWLDLARFAESNGYEHDEVRPDAWRYRDYVVFSLNVDKPYDRFVEEQLAGDELFPGDTAALTATGFNLLGPDMTDSSDQVQRRHNTLNDMTDTAGLVFLGLTIGCARCHDHKFEPIPQSDYYRFQAFFTPASFRSDLVIATGAERAAHESAAQEYNALTRPARDEIARLEEPCRKRIYEAKLGKLSDEAQIAHRTPPADRTPGQKDLVEKTARLLAISGEEVLSALSAGDKARRTELDHEIQSFEKKKPAPLPVAMGLQDSGNASKTFVLERGDPGRPLEEVEPGHPRILQPPKSLGSAPTAHAAPSVGSRAALAQWIVSKENPLAARVLVQRLWQHHFGRGLTSTSSDFGTRGESPTHVKLLDWLAVELMARGWSLKEMHRLMLLSATYQQSSKASRLALAKDPENKLLSHANRWRLEGEAVRDGLLFVSGRLNEQMGGPGVFPPMPAEALKGFKGWTPSPDPRDPLRRSMYIFQRRNLRFPFLEAFDLPDSNLSCPQRERSTTAPQALVLLNAADVVEAATALAESASKEAGTEAERVDRIYRLALGRRPSPTERDFAHDFLKRSPLGELCRALFNLNEFVYVD